MCFRSWVRLLVVHAEYLVDLARLVHRVVVCRSNVEPVRLTCPA